jgi:hypothetical protein
MPKASSSSRFEFENIAIAAFEVVYRDWNGSTATEPTEVWFTIMPLTSAVMVRKLE